MSYCFLVLGFAGRCRIYSLFTKQKVGLRAVIPEYVNFRYNDGSIPGHTEDSFKTYGILTVHSAHCFSCTIKQSNGQLQGKTPPIARLKCSVYLIFILYKIKIVYFGT